jgi:hypothetical protein
MLKVQAMRQESLRRLAEKKAQAVELNPPNGGFDGTPPTLPGPPTT